ncbi:MAG: F0F1 ATP synthase subunit gamma, partial [Bdellovibrionales bacterium]|nr:F0F1 ATP synthase subunit gamma [Bdellovibrionales bacterium]
MAGLKDIKRRIKSVKNTKKITYAMKLVSAAKLKKAQDAVKASREYTDALTELLANLSRECEGADFSHPLMEAHTEVKKVRLIIIGGSRGLCGGYNTNINKRVLKAIDELSEKHPGAVIESVILGKKPAEFFRIRQMKYAASHEGLPEDANLWPVDDICLQLESDFLKGEIDEAYLLYTQFRS